MILPVEYIFATGDVERYKVASWAFKNKEGLRALNVAQVTEAEGLDAIFISVTMAEGLGVAPNPYEAVVVPSRRPPPVPRFVVVGGRLELGDDPFSSKASVATFFAILSAVGKHNAISVDRIRRVGLLADDFIPGNRDRWDEEIIALVKTYDSFLHKSSLRNN